MSKMLPKKYGEKIAVTGEDGGPIELAVSDRRARAAKLIEGIFSEVKEIEHGEADDSGTSDD